MDEDHLWALAAAVGIIKWGPKGSGGGYRVVTNMSYL